MCGIVGLVKASDPNGHVVQQLVDGLMMVQHRGQDAAGIVTIKDSRLNLVKSRGTVSEVFTQAAALSLEGNVGIGHVRYPTSGGGCNAEAQPLYVNSPFGLAIAHNGNLTNTDQMMQSMQQEHRHINTDSDSELLLNVFAEELQSKTRSSAQITVEEIFDAVRSVMRRCKGGFAVCILVNRVGVVSFRDPNGIRPLCIGHRSFPTPSTPPTPAEGSTNWHATNATKATGDRTPVSNGIKQSRMPTNRLGYSDSWGAIGSPKAAKASKGNPSTPASASAFVSTTATVTANNNDNDNNNAACDWAVASESVAIDALAPDFVQDGDVHPGEAVFFSLTGHMRRQVLHPHAQLRPCLFEFCYFARPDSILDGVQVYEARLRMGQKLAARVLEALPGPLNDVEAVIPIPETSRTSAMALSQQLGIPYREGFIKNRYIARTFIMPGQEQRRKTVRLKLNTIKAEFKGKNVLLVDDSIVRGTTGLEIVKMAREAGAKKVYFASAAPPVVYNNVYGIDIPTRSELVAFGRTTEEITQFLDCDRVIYNTLEDVEESVRSVNPKQLCHGFESSCFNGDYVTADVDEEYLRGESMKRGLKRGSLSTITTAAANASTLSTGGETGAGVGVIVGVGVSAGAEDGGVCESLHNSSWRPSSSGSGAGAEGGKRVRGEESESLERGL